MALFLVQIPDDHSHEAPWTVMFDGAAPPLGHPPGVEVYTQETSPFFWPGETYIDIAHIRKFVKARATHNHNRTARATYWWLVQHAELEVRCSACQDRFGRCRCPDRGYKVDGRWRHRIAAEHSEQYEDFWVVGRRSLVALAATHQPNSHFTHWYDGTYLITSRTK